MALAVCVFMTGSLTAGAAGGTSLFITQDKKENEGSDKDLSAARNEINDIKAERRSAEERLQNLKNDKSNLEAYIQELDENLTQIQGIIRRLEAAMETTQAEIVRTQAELETAKETERSQYEAMRLRIQYMYETGDIQYLEILLESRSLADFLNRAEYISGMVEYDRNMLTAYQETCQKIEESEALLEQEYADLEDLKAINEESQADLELLMGEKNVELNNYTVQINEATEEINSYTKAMEEQERLIQQIEEQIRRQEEEARRKKEEERRKKEEEERRQKEEEERRKKEEESRRQEEESRKQEESSGESEGSETGGSNEGGETSGETGETTGSSEGGETGTTGSNEGGGEGDSNEPAGGDEETPQVPEFQWPIPDSSRITSRFGPRKPPLPGVSDFHKGVDVGARTGTKIYAAASGTVVISQYNYSAGNYIMINHGNGVYTVYMHCSELLVSVGDEVKQGDNIGLVGSTGYSTAPHLHFGVRIDGEYQDPLKYVSP